jgi:hypothetical protein
MKWSWHEPGLYRHAAGYRQRGTFFVVYESGFVAGQTLNVDGGRTDRL